MLKNIPFVSYVVLIVPLFSYANNDLVWYDDPFSGLIYEEHSCADETTSISSPEQKQVPVITPKSKPIPEQTHYVSSTAYNDAMSHQYAGSSPAPIYADASYQGLAKEANILLGIPEHKHIGIKKIIKECVKAEYSACMIISEEGIFINEEYYDTLPYAVKRLYIFCAVNSHYYTFGNRSFLQKIGVSAHHIPDIGTIYYEAVKKAACHKCFQETLDFEELHDEDRPGTLSAQKTAEVYHMLTENNSLCMHHA